MRGQRRKISSGNGDSLLKTKVDPILADARDPSVAADPASAELSRQDIDALRDQLEDIRAKAEEIKSKIDNKVREVAEQKARLEAARQQAIADAREARDTINNVCDETDGTNREGDIGVDKTTEFVLREEIKGGKPIKTQEGHYLKIVERLRALREATNDLRRARAEFNSAQPPVDDPALVKSLDEASRRAADRSSKMRQALQEWNQRAKTNPNEWNLDGTSKVVHKEWLSLAE